MNIEQHDSGPERQQGQGSEDFSFHRDESASTDMTRVSAYLDHLIALSVIEIPGELQAYAQVQGEYKQAFTTLLARTLGSTSSLEVRNKALVITEILGQQPIEISEREMLVDAITRGLQSEVPTTQVHLMLRSLQTVLSEEQCMEAGAARLSSYLESRGSSLDKKTIDQVEKLFRQHPTFEQASLPHLWKHMKEGALSAPFFIQYVKEFQASSVDIGAASSSAKALAEVVAYGFSGDSDTIEQLKRDALVHLYEMKEGALAALPVLIAAVGSERISADVCTYVSEVLAEHVQSLSVVDLLEYKDIFEQQLTASERAVLPEPAVENIAKLVSYGALRNEEFRSMFFTAVRQGRVSSETFCAFMEVAQGLFDDDVVEMLMDFPFDDHGSKAEQTLIAGCAHLGPIGFQALKEYLNPDASVYLLKRVIPPFATVVQEGNELAHSQAASCCSALGKLATHKYLEVRYHSVQALGNLSTEYDDVRRINRARHIKDEVDASEVVKKWIWKVRRAADRACVAIQKRIDPYQSS